MYYYLIDLTDPEEDSNGFSGCISCDTPLTDNEVLSAAVELKMFDSDDYAEYDTKVIDITNNPKELNHYKWIADHYQKD